MTTTISLDLETLRAEYDRRSAALQALGDESAALPQLQTAALQVDDAERYATLRQRGRDLPVPLAFAQLRYAETGVALARAEVAEIERHHAENPPKPVSAVEAGGLSFIVPQDYQLARARLNQFLERLEHAQRECARLGATQ